MDYRCKKITILTGHYGCGKTNLAVNLAVKMQNYGKVAVVDMDTVNPYFRTADFRDSFSGSNIEVICPRYANTNLDIPVLDFDMERIASESDYMIIDVGGSDAGAYALGRYRGVFENYPGETEVLYVFSMYRSPDMTAEETAAMMPEIENACGLKCTALVNNSNLGTETDYETVLASAEFADRVSELTGLPIAFRCVPEDCEECGNNDFPVRRMVRFPWEE
ncbi:MAG: cobalamin biosynthesis protein CobQ [Porcipelethomonas sp.]